MKKSQIFLIVAGFIFAALGILYGPVYFGTTRAQKAYAQAGNYLESGNFTEGAPMMRYSFEMLKLTRGTVPTVAAENARYLVLAGAQRNPLQAAEALRFMRDYSLPASCEEKLQVASTLLTMAVQLAGSDTPKAMGSALYNAALWAQDCPLPADAATAMSKSLDAYKQFSGFTFAPDSWVSKARQGAFVDDSLRVPIASKEEIAKRAKTNIVAGLKESIAAVQHSVMKLATGNLAQTPQPAPVAATPAPAAAQPQTPATATAATPAPPATATVAEPETTATKPAKIEPAKKETPKKEIPKPAKPAKPAKPQPSELVAKPPQPEKPEPSKPKSPPAARSVKNEIIADLQAQSVPVQTIEFASNRKSATIMIASDNSGQTLRRELRAVMKTVYQKANMSSAMKLSSVDIVYRSNKNTPRYRWHILVKDYEDYLNNKINGTEFYQRWGRMTDARSYE